MSGGSSSAAGLLHGRPRLRAAGWSLLGLAASSLLLHRLGDAWVGLSGGIGNERRARGALAEVRRLAENVTSSADICAQEGTGLPIFGVQYVPHIVGEPYPHPSSKPDNIYGPGSRMMYARDFPLIRQLGADTLRFRPWGAENDRADLFAAMEDAAICKIVPTFQLAKHYADMLSQDLQQPDTDQNSALHKEFSHFTASLFPDKIGHRKVAAWSLDLSLDLFDLLPIATDCSSRPSLATSTGKNFNRYMALLNVLTKWVRPRPGEGSPKIASEAPWLAKVPLLVPLDLSRARQVGNWQESLRMFLSCLTTWEPHVFAQDDEGANGRLLLSFSLPYEGYPFKQVLSTLATELRKGATKAVVMVGSEALRPDPDNAANLIDDSEDNGTTPQDLALLNAYKAYADINGVQQDAFDGFLLDEWQDDWDRGSNGPFFLAAGGVDGMRDVCVKGGRYSHDTTRCARKVGNGWVYPEYFGQARISSQFWRHCSTPRARVFPWFNDEEGVGLLPAEAGIQCRRLLPSWNWEAMAGSVLGLVLFVQACQTLMKNCSEGSLSDSEGEEEDRPVNSIEAVGYVTITPQEPQLQGGHIIELHSTRMKSNEDVGWWLHAHLSAQLGILEKQVHAEVAAQRAEAFRAQRQVSQASESESEESESGSESDAPNPGDEGELLQVAMETVHRRVMEGFANWCLYVKDSPQNLEKDRLKEYADAVIKNSGRTVSRLFAEALLLRVLESLGELILSAPERLAFLYYHVVADSGLPMPEDDHGPAKYVINFEDLQDGLPQMMHHSNPYIKKKMPDGSWQLGLNFDDINESGIQCREGVTKTFKESASIAVFIDGILCYRVPLMMKVWALMIAFYIYLGTGYGQDISTLNNGTVWWPEWLRMNFIQYCGIIDGCIWVVLEVLYVLYNLWQRGPSLCYRFPGQLSLTLIAEHLLNVAFSGLGAFYIYQERDFQRKPSLCSQAEMIDCRDPRAENFATMWAALQPAIYYWGFRVCIFLVMNRKHYPIHIRGNPAFSRFTGAGWFQSVRVNLMWLVMLGMCVLVEVYFVFPSARGLDLGTLCSFDLLGSIYVLPRKGGQCSEESSLLNFDCVACISSVVAAQVLMFLTSMVDIYFMFYIFSAIVGSFMGSRRHLNDLKNTSVPLDLRPDKGKEALLFKETFGPGWQRVWCAMLKHLMDECYISPRQAESLAAAARCSLDSATLLGESDSKREKAINLKKFPELASERLEFFFHSLKWIKNPSGPVRGWKFRTETDSLTGRDFDTGSVPSLTMIIPAYNEVVIPSAESLREGNCPEDAMNQNPDNNLGVGDLTNPPVGDGVNTNLAFIISQFPDEWVFLAERLCKEELVEDPSSHRLYKRFINGSLHPHVEAEIRIWTMLRTQSVGRTVVGALQTGRALSALPKIQEYYARRPDKRIPEDHAEVILAHQTYGQAPPEGDPANDDAVRFLLQRYKHDSLWLVFDLNPATDTHTRNLVNEFLRTQGGYGIDSFTYASIKCRWDPARQDVSIVAVLPRKFPLRLGQGDFKTQGKACNQLNGLRFASGHYIQALDCNMGVFIGEGFKVPYVLRSFMPLGKKSRVAPRCRYLGFREYIFTGREGTVGKCHASAEWTFGTIYQRFLSGMGTRMHYGHPDFVDGFWARNRGGMSKCSPVVNLSEDIFAGYNVRMREESSPHIDALEFEKGRESTFNAASNFFSKISGGSIAVLRSRDNHLLCERVGIFHSWSFYFTSVAFYLSNLLIDISIYLYVGLFIVFTLANIDLGKLSALGSTFSTEWVMSMGIFSLFPQLLEMILEFGALKAFREVLGMIPAATFFFIFQNKNISSAMRNGAATGIAKYFFTGRPMANQHQTWRDIYVTYSKSHYKPAFTLMKFYVIYQVLVAQTFQGNLPMVLIVISFMSWLVTPIIFSPFPRWSLIEQDIKEFSAFVNGQAGKEEHELMGDNGVVSRGKKGKARTLWECGLSAEISVWSETSTAVLLVYVVVEAIVTAYIMLLIPAEILDFLWIYIITLCFNCLLVFGYLSSGLSNILLNLQTVSWFLAVPIGGLVLGDRVHSPSTMSRAPEFVIALIVFLHVLSLIKQAYLLCIRIACDARVCAGSSQSVVERHLYEAVRRAFLYFQVHQADMAEAYIIMCLNIVVSLLLALVDRLGCNLHTWWLLNRELSRTKQNEEYLSKDPPRMEGATTRAGSMAEHLSDFQGSEGSQDAEFTDHVVAQHSARPLLANNHAV